MELLDEHEIIEKRIIKIRGIPEEEPRVAAYRITPLGLDVLNELVAQKINRKLALVSGLGFAIGFIQLIVGILQLTRHS